jgi:hypothetical protein
MAIKFPHAMGWSVKEDEFREAWTLLHLQYGRPDVPPNELPILQLHEGFDALAEKGRQLSLDYLCRLLVPATLRNTTQGSKTFIKANEHIVEVTPYAVMNPATDRSVEGVRLRPGFEIVSPATERLFLAAEDDSAAEVREGTVARPLQPGISLACSSWRSGPDFVRLFVETVATDPFIAYYRKKPLPLPAVTGWDARLNAYFWPNPAVTGPMTTAAIAPMVLAFTPLAAAVRAGAAWTSAQKAAAVTACNDIFDWGSVPQDPSTVTPSNIRAVIDAALHDDAASTALMNSGWTKVAALATGDCHVIWDSRVSTSVVRRLDRLILLSGVKILTAPYDLIGLVNVGRGGSRPVAPGHLNLRWRGGYGSWLAQVTGSAFLRCVRDELNDPKVGWTARHMPWTLRDVEMVLFMDGY